MLKKQTLLTMACCLLVASSACKRSSDDDDNDTAGKDAGVTLQDAGTTQTDGAVSATDASTTVADASVSPPDAGEQDSGIKPTNVEFLLYEVDTAAAGAAYVAVADINNDSKLDLIVSKFGTPGLTNPFPPGEVTAYLQGSSFQDWTQEPIVTAAEGIKYPGLANPVDVDGDGDLDVILPAGFLACVTIPGVAGTGPCGAMLWMEKTDNGWVRHDIVPNGNPEFFHHAVLVDFDGDSVKDLVTVAEKKTSALGGNESYAKTMWFKGTTDSTRFETTSRVIGDGLGSFPTVRDMDGDADLDIASAEYFMKDCSFAWFERTGEPSGENPAGTFTRHVVNNDSGPAIMLAFVDDLYGDGVMHPIGANHVNTNNTTPDPWPSAVYVFDVPANPRESWTKHIISTGIGSRPNGMFGMQVMGAPGIFGVGDIDGDGDKDVLVSGDGDIRVFWLEQLPNKEWATHVLLPELGQAGGMLVRDLNGDGKAEMIVTGYEANALNVLERK